MELSQKIALILRLDIAVNRLDGAFYMWARRHKLPENMLTMLYALADGARSQREISEDWLIPKTTVNTLTNELVEEGFASLGKGKEKLLSLTEKGMRLAEESLKELHSAELDAIDSVLEEFPPEFVAALERYTAVFSQKLGIKTGY